MNGSVTSDVFGIIADTEDEVVDVVLPDEEVDLPEVDDDVDPIAPPVKKAKPIKDGDELDGDEEEEEEEDLADPDELGDDDLDFDGGLE